jgi:N4-(beta-N-acetylglucosaminyl)-L-asparaginase
MGNRRNFIRNSALATMGALAVPKILKSQKQIFEAPFIGKNKPIVLSTWNHGIPANKKAWEILSSGGLALDAVEQGVMITEADPEGQSVGMGGMPDRDGIVTLDACIMDDKSNCGSVCFLEQILHPISVARLVMEKTPHVMLAGEGAQQFALENGFELQDLLTERSKKDWLDWSKKANYLPKVNWENHDTIGMIALDEKGRLAGACTTSGMAFKMHGRVGDSPIIGAGLFVDGEVGAAVATGHGEMMMKTLASFVVVEAMRNGASPQEACELAIERISKKVSNYKEGQAGFIALNTKGEFGAYGLVKGFNIAVCDEDGNRMIDADYLIKE